MRHMLLAAGIVLLCLGLLWPLLLIPAVVVLVIGALCAPPGLRPDGRPRTGGLLGGLWDAVALALRGRARR